VDRRHERGQKETNEEKRGGNDSQALIRQCTLHRLSYNEIPFSWLLDIVRRSITELTELDGPIVQ